MALAEAAVAATRRVPGAALAATLGLLWFALGPRTPDLAAAVYRSSLFAREGFQLYDSAWFAGHHLPGYSVLAPALGSVIGVREMGVLAAVLSAVCFERLATARWGVAARPAVLWFAAATVADLMIGRITFGMGVAIGLAALLALQHRLRPLVVLLAAACSATSPVAGLFLTLVMGTIWLSDRARTDALVGVGTALLVVVALSIAFPEGGAQPFAIGAMLMILASSLLVVVVAADREPEIRLGAILYAAIAIVALLAPTPMGSNLSRLGAAFAGPLVLAMLLARPRSERLTPTLLALALVPLIGWQWLAPVREVSRGIGDPAYSATYYSDMLDFIGRDSGGKPVRVEVPFTRSHWESVYIAPSFPLARGWQTQLDKKYNALFFADKIDPRAYRAWLQRNAVSYVAVPDVPLDPAGRAEAELVDSRPEFLEEVWTNGRWDVFKVRDPRPLISGAGELVRLEPERMVLEVRDRESVVVRVRWTPYWVVEGGGCVARAGAWTRVTPLGSGRVVVRARFAAKRLFDRNRNCSSPATGPGT